MQESSNPGAAWTQGAFLVDVLDRLKDQGEVFFRSVRSVGDVLNPRLSPLTLDDKVSVAWKRLDEEGLAELPVIDLERGDKGTPDKRIAVGTARKKDLARILSQFAGTLSQSDSDVQIMGSTVAAHIVRRQPALRIETPLFKAIEEMINGGSDVLVAGNEDGTYAGALTSVDLLKCFGRLDTLRRARPAEQPREARLVDLLAGGQGGSMATDAMLATFFGRAQDVMRGSAPSVKLTDKVDDAIRTMEQKKCSCLLVVDQVDVFKGIVTDLDIQLALPPQKSKKMGRETTQTASVFDLDRDDRETKKILSDRVTTVAQTNVQTVAPNEATVKIAELCSGGRVSYLPVVTGVPPQAKGLLSRFDLLRALLGIGDLAKKGGLLDNAT